MWLHIHITFKVFFLSIKRRKKAAQNKDRVYMHKKILEQFIGTMVPPIIYQSQKIRLGEGLQSESFQIRSIQI